VLDEWFESDVEVEACICS